MTVDETMMARAVALARRGMTDTSPNPMVGCVITDRQGQIIGEGFHRRCGEGHAEVNAVASVSNPDLLRQATVYVTLEPCAHQGRTPSCARMLARAGVPRVVVGATDPNPLVAGQGIEILRQAGAEVITGVLEQQCIDLNPKFLTAFTCERPFVTLKWAMSADGFTDRLRTPAHPEAARFSSPLTTAAVHRLRALHDAVLVGSGTVLADDPQLTVRSFGGRQPLRVVADRSGRVTGEHRVFTPDAPSLLCSPMRPAGLPDHVEWIAYSPDDSICDLLKALRRRGITSLLVEGGATLHTAFLHEGCWDRMRVETAPMLLGQTGICPAPRPGLTPFSIRKVDGRTISEYRNSLSSF